MSKFTHEQKLKAVKLYLQGESSQKIITDFNIGTHSQLLFWVKKYKKAGSSGLKEKRNHQDYTPEFKLSVLNWKKDNNATYEATALHFDISSPSIIYQWQRLFNNNKLHDRTKKRGRPALVKNHSFTLSDSERAELEKLRKQNQKLLAENEHLKALVP